MYSCNTRLVDLLLIYYSINPNAYIYIYINIYIYWVRNSCRSFTWRSCCAVCTIVLYCTVIYLEWIAYIYVYIYIYWVRNSCRSFTWRSCCAVCTIVLYCAVIYLEWIAYIYIYVYIYIYIYIYIYMYIYNTDQRALLITEIMTWTINYIYVKQWKTISHPCPNLNGV